MLRPDLQPEVRFASARARPRFQLRRRARLCRSQVLRVSARNDPGLGGDADAPGFRLQDPQRAEVVRLRNVIQLGRGAAPTSLSVDQSVSHAAQLTLTISG